MNDEINSELLVSKVVEKPDCCTCEVFLTAFSDAIKQVKDALSEEHGQKLVKNGGVIYE